MSDRQDLVSLGRNSPFLQIEDMPIANLKPNSRHARKHPDEQIAMLARNIDAVGFLVPCLIDEANKLLTGTARVMAAERLGMKTVPVIRVSHLSEVEKRAFVIADNKLAETAVWDADALRGELQFFNNLNIDFDFSVIGFKTAEVDIILDCADADGSDEPLPDLTGPAASRLGDLWQAGAHRIYCGDALDTASYEALLANERAQLVFTDPPYNISIGQVGGAGRVQHREFAMACGEMSPDVFTSFLTKIVQKLTAYSVDGSLHYLAMDWRHCQEILTAGNATYSELKGICVWRKTNAGMGSLYRSQHEFFFVYKNGKAPHINNINLGVHGRNRSNVWDYGGINSFGKDRDELLAMHPTVKPVALIADIIKDASHRGGIVLDVFGGSGSTLIAAEKTKRRAALIEIDPLYVDSTIRRWRALTGNDAVCVNTGATFAEREATACDVATKSGEDGARS
ncbi:site-specific DNA-methyltransferase [Afipia sp. DC4300-2b1]|uniref:site-specific DNA-methyltransferase n=1 Tax=Afipia sp. DC4300-2b1 TaxID=2804672 RepID=UPI003CF07781